MKIQLSFFRRVFFSEKQKKPRTAPSESGKRRIRDQVLDESLLGQLSQQRRDQKNPGRPRLRLSDFPKTSALNVQYRDGYQVGSDEEDPQDPTYGQPPTDVLKGDNERGSKEQNKTEDSTHEINDIASEEADRPTLVDGINPGTLTPGKRYLVRLIRRIKNLRKKS